MEVLSTRDLSTVPQNEKSGGYIVSDELQKSDSNAVALAAGHQILDWAIVDNYALSAPWHKASRSFASKIMAIDDLALFDLDCDIVLNQTANQFLDIAYKKLVSADCSLNLGPTHVILDRAFSDAQQCLSPKNSVKNILIYLGSNDQENITEVATLGICELTGKSITILLGLDHPHRERLIKFSASKTNVTLIEYVDNIADFMGNFDLCIGVCGMSVWERCSIGLPSIVCVTAENQRADADALSRSGATILIPDSDKAKPIAWQEAVMLLDADMARFTFLKNQCRFLVQGWSDNLKQLVEQIAG